MLFVAVCLRASQIKLQISVLVRLTEITSNSKELRQITKFLTTFLPLESFTKAKRWKMLQNYFYFDDKSLPFWCQYVNLYPSAFLYLFTVKKEKCHQFQATQQTVANANDTRKERFVWFKWNCVIFIFFLFFQIVFLRYSIFEGIACHSECLNRALCECLLCFKLNFPWIIVVQWNLENCKYVCKCFTVYECFNVIYYPLIFVVVCGHVCFLLQESEGKAWQKQEFMIITETRRTENMVMMNEL